MRLNDAQRRLFAERATELGNFAVTGLLIGQVIAGQFQLGWTLWGAAIGLIMYYAGWVLTREDRNG